MRLHAHRRTLHALACLLAFTGSLLMAFALLGALTSRISAENFDDPQSLRALALLDGQSCGAARVAQAAQVAQVAQVTPSASPLPSASPSPSVSPSPSFAPISPAGGTLYETPFPTGTPAVTPPPVPTPAVAPSASSGPVFLVRPSSTPSITPAREASPAPTPTPTGAPTLRPGYVAVMADKVVGSTKVGMPGDATGNVHVFYQDEVIVGDRAHYDGIRTITLTGNPYIVNNAQNTVLYADKIVFDTVAEKAQLFNGRGESSQGIEHGLVYYSSKHMETDQHGVAHGDYASVTTCERPRSGYHITGKTINVIPGDRIVITKAILWLGAAAVFFLPRVVIPLRTVTDERRRPQFFPEIGYNSYQGFYVKARIGFGNDDYYYGDYRIEFYSKQGMSLGYDGTITKRNGRRQTQISVLRVQDRVQQTVSYNASAQDTENYSQHLRGQFSYSYQSNFGPLVSLPPTTAINAQMMHNNGTESQTYTYTRNTTGAQSNSNTYGFSDRHAWGTSLQNDLSANLSHSMSDYGGFFSENASGTLNDLLNWSTRGASYQLTYSKNYARTPYGINKEPELQVRPYKIIHFIFPISPTLTIGEYSEPATPETTQRADLALTMGPLLYHVLGSDFTANFVANQFAYGTGDMKANISQNMTLDTPINGHMTNTINYNEQNYSGPAAVPFSTMDLQNSQNVKNAADVLRIFNGDVYNLDLSYNTRFDGQAEPISYQLATRPSVRSSATISGYYAPGPGNGFSTTNLQFSTPFGNGSWLQFLGDLDWKNKGRIENKSIYYSRIIGDCYEIQLQYNQNSKALNMSLSLLAFPSHTASFGLTNTGSIVPGSMNGQP